MKKIMFFVLFFILYFPILKSMQDSLVPSFSESICVADQSVPVFSKYFKIPISENLSLLLYRVLKSVNDGGSLVHTIEERIPIKIPWACKLIKHGQDTGQLRMPRITQQQKDIIIEAVAMQLLQLDIKGIDEEGNLDPKLTTLFCFFIENKTAHTISPLHTYEDETTQKVPTGAPPLRRALFN